VSSPAGIEPLLLDTQYRMHPLIAHLPSKLFYEGRLQSGQPLWGPICSPSCSFLYASIHCSTLPSVILLAAFFVCLLICSSFSHPSSLPPALPPSLSLRFFICSCTHSCIHSFIHPSMHSFIHPSIHAFFHSCIHPFIHSSTLSLLCLCEQHLGHSSVQVKSSPFVHWLFSSDCVLAVSASYEQLELISNVTDV